MCSNGISPADLEHPLTCQIPTRDCAHCLFLYERSEGHRTWLFHGSNGFGCRYCRRSKVINDWGLGRVTAASSFRKQSLDRHEASKLHTAAARRDGIIDSTLVPPKLIFENVLEALISGIYSCRAIAERCNASRTKVLNIKKCFGRACVNETKAFFRSEGLVLSLHQDASQCWLCVRYTGCNNQLEKKSGLISFINLKAWIDGFAEHLKDATLHAILQVCSGSGSEETDIDLAARVCKAVEVYNADAARDEQLTGEILRGQSLGGVIYNPAMLPALKVVHKDKAHAARRLTSRGWKADPFLEKVRSAEIREGDYPTLIRKFGRKGVDSGVRVRGKPSGMQFLFGTSFCDVLLPDLPDRCIRVWWPKAALCSVFSSLTLFKVFSTTMCGTPIPSSSRAPALRTSEQASTALKSHKSQT